MARNPKQRDASDLQERVVFIHRVSKVVKGGRRFALTALVVVGDGNGRVGIGMGKSQEVPIAIKKGVEDAKKNMFTVPLTEAKTLPHEVMGEYGATVAGFATPGLPSVAARLTDEAVAALPLPVLAQLVVKKVDPRQGEMTKDNPYYTPDVLIGAATELRAHGVQFLRAAGHATPAFTSALVAATAGFDVARSDVESEA